MLSSEERDLVNAASYPPSEKSGLPMRQAENRGSQWAGRILPYLTIGARAAVRFEGTLFLDVWAIRPGESAVIDQECYRSLAPVELFRKPVPKPEDRNYYREFSARPHDLARG